MPCTPSVQVVDVGSDAHLVLDDCASPLAVVPLNPLEALVVAAALDTSAVHTVTTVMSTMGGSRVKILRVENPPAKDLVSVAIQDGPPLWIEVLIGPEIAEQRADELRSAVA